jgi:hypothetical protein
MARACTYAQQRNMQARAPLPHWYLGATWFSKDAHWLRLHMCTWGRSRHHGITPQPLAWPISARPPLRHRPGHCMAGQDRGASASSQPLHQGTKESNMHMPSSCQRPRQAGPPFIHESSMLDDLQLYQQYTPDQVRHIACIVRYHGCHGCQSLLLVLDLRAPLAPLCSAHCNPPGQPTQAACLL